MIAKWGFVTSRILFPARRSRPRTIRQTSRLPGVMSWFVGNITTPGYRLPYWGALQATSVETGRSTAQSPARLIRPKRLASRRA
jgi:hypothetical protein